MKFEDLETKTFLRYSIGDETMTFLITRIDKRSRTLYVMRTDQGYWGWRHEIPVAADEELEVYSRDRYGVLLTPGMTKAEIIANELAIKARAAGNEAEVTVSQENGYVYASVWIKGKTLWDTSYNAGWMTSTEGRKTTHFVFASEMRGALRNKKTKRKMSIKLTQQKFFRALRMDTFWEINHPEFAS